MYLRQIAKAPPANVMAPYLMQATKNIGAGGVKFAGINNTPGGGTTVLNKSKFNAMLENLKRGNAKK